MATGMNPMMARNIIRQQQAELDRNAERARQRKAIDGPRDARPVRSALLVVAVLLICVAAMLAAVTF